MTYHDANEILDRRRAGESMPQAVVLRALELTGDLEPDVVRDAAWELDEEKKASHA